MKNITRHLFATLLILAAGLLITSCNEDQAKEDQHTTDHDNHNHEEHESGETSESPDKKEVIITQRQMKAMGIQTARIQKRNLSDIVKAFGNITLPPGQKETISPVIGGIIRNIKVISGDYVQKGQTIARIEHPDIVDLQNEFLETKNKNEYLETEYNRQKRLFRDSINSAKTYQQIKSEYQSNRSRLQSLRQKLKLLHLNPDELTPENITNSYPLVSPINGYVAHIEANNGMNVNEGQNLFLLNNNDKAHIDLEVYEKDIARIEKGQTLTFNLNNNPLSSPLKGKVIKKARNFDTEKRTALIHADITDKNKNLLPGMSVIAHIQTGGKKQNSLPVTAFVQDRGKTWVFIQKHQEAHSDDCSHDAAEKDQHDHAKEHNGSEESHDHEHAKEQTSADKADASTNHQHAEEFVFQRIEVYKGTTEAGFSGLTFKNPVDNDAVFATGNVQAILAEMKKSSGSEGGHGHAH